MSSENINSAVSSENEEDDCSDKETESDIRHGTWTEQSCFVFIWKPGLNIEIQDSENLLEFCELFITLEISELAGKLDDVLSSS